MSKKNETVNEVYFEAEVKYGGKKICGDYVDAETAKKIISGLYVDPNTIDPDNDFDCEDQDVEDELREVLEKAKEDYANAKSAGDEESKGKIRRAVREAAEAKRAAAEAKKELKPVKELEEKIKELEEENEELKETNEGLEKVIQEKDKEIEDLKKSGNSALCPINDAGEYIWYVKGDKSKAVSPKDALDWIKIGLIKVADLKYGTSKQRGKKIVIDKETGDFDPDDFS